jgi:hypothetical protein
MKSSLRTATLVAIALSSTITGCKPNDNASSDVSGATIEEIQASQAATGQTVKPDYGQLFLATDAVKTVKMSVFISLAEEAGPDGVDYGTSAFTSLRDWLSATATPDSGFLKSPIVSGVGENITITGKGPAIGGLGRQMSWEIHLRVGKAEAIAREFGEAIATSHIAILNGHFYPGDARAANVGAGEGMPSFYRQMTSEIYGPAMEAFKAKAPASPLPYRIVGFNGCYSEAIEDLVLKTTQDAGQPNVDIVGQRGRSNFHYFGPQMASFLKSLVGGQTWPETLASLKFEKADWPYRVTPVLRNRTIGRSYQPNEFEE